MSSVLESHSPVFTSPGHSPDEDRRERAAIDASCRTPVLYAFGSAICWLVLGSLFGLLASIKLHSPDDLTGHLSWFTFGRVRTAHMNIVTYGWSALAGVGVSIWLMARLCRTKLVAQSLIMLGITLWNIALIVGIFGILKGDMTSIKWLELPKYASPLLFAAFALSGIWVVYMFTQRQPGHVYVSQWYLILAFFSFPWVYGTAQLLLLMHPVQGSVFGLINFWYINNILSLFFTPIALAAAYYFIPKVIGKPIHSYHLAIVGFWTMAFFSNWAGMHHMIGGPAPAWMVTVSVVSSVLILIPVITVAINFHMTMEGSFEALRYSPTLRFVVFGAVAYTLASFQGVLMSFQGLNNVTHFTDYSIGHSHLGMYAFYTMVMFGSIYYIVPRLIQWEWPSAWLIRMHFWFTVLGSSLMIITLTTGGLIQGMGLNDEKVPFSAIIDSEALFRITRSFAGMAMLIGHLAFASVFALMLLKFGHRSTGATLLHREIPES